MKLKIVLSVFVPVAFMIGNFKICHSEIFTNPFELKQIFLAEGKIAEKLSKAAAKLTAEVDLNQELLNQIKSYVRDQTVISEEMDSMSLNDIDPDDIDDPLMNLVVGNPIHVYKMVKRILFYLNPILDKMENGPYSEFKEVIAEAKKQKKEVVWVTQDDMVGASVSLARIQITYMLDPVEISHGKLLTRQTKARLSSDDCFSIGTARLGAQHKAPRVNPNNGPEYAIAIEWIEAGLRLLADEESTDKLETEEETKKFLLSIRQKHDDTFRLADGGNGSSNFPNEQYFIRKIGQDLTLTGSKLRSEEEHFFRTQRYSSRVPGEGFYFRDFYYLCRGLKLRRAEGFQEKEPTCYYSWRNSPYLILQPLKVEVLSHDPQVLVLHQFVTKQELNYIKSESRSQFKRASTSVESSTSGETQVILDRTQSSMWIEDSVKSLASLTKRLDYATGLQVSRVYGWSKIHKNIFESESLQVGIYGPGGLYLPHYDAFSRPEPNWYAYDNIYVGNRIATVMIYLTGNIVGGGTAFPKAGVAAFPEEGSLVFWYNLLLDGSKDLLSLHGACPTILGIKWVGNKWIREGCQVFNRPCDVEKSN